MCVKSGIICTQHAQFAQSMNATMLTKQCVQMCDNTMLSTMCVHVCVKYKTEIKFDRINQELHAIVNLKKYRLHMYRYPTFHGFLFIH